MNSYLETINKFEQLVNIFEETNVIAELPTQLPNSYALDTLNAMRSILNDAKLLVVGHDVRAWSIEITMSDQLVYIQNWFEKFCQMAFGVSVQELFEIFELQGVANFEDRINLIEKMISRGEYGAWQDMVVREPYNVLELETRRRYFQASYNA